MKQTKIIATIGPASQDAETLSQMIKAGMNVARLNFSHGTYANHALLMENIRKAAKKHNTYVGIMQDLSGPKLRLGEFKDIMVKPGQILVLGHGGIPVQKEIWKWIKPGQSILIDDGLIEVIATKIHPDAVESRVVSGGKLISHKGVSLPGVKVDLPSISEKDLTDLEFGLKMGVDFVAISFIKTADDINKLRAIIKRFTKRFVPIVAKIETPEALKNFDAIMHASDVIMVARGDLGLNVQQAYEPVAQKKIVYKSFMHGKPVIMATQMLESMINNPRPTRAELSDVANAVIDHVDCLMLSGESAFGKYPVKTVETMSQVIKQVELSPYDDYKHSENAKHSKSAVLAHNLMHFLKHSRGVAIAVSDIELAHQLSSFRPEFPIAFFSHKEDLLRRASILWGVRPFLMKGTVSGMLKNAGVVHPGKRYLDATSHSWSATVVSL